MIGVSKFLQSHKVTTLTNSWFPRDQLELIGDKFLKSYRVTTLIKNIEKFRHSVFEEIAWLTNERTDEQTEVKLKVLSDFTQDQLGRRLKTLQGIAINLRYSFL